MKRSVKLMVAASGAGAAAPGELNKRLPFRRGRWIRIWVMGPGRGKCGELLLISFACIFSG